MLDYALNAAGFLLFFFFFLLQSRHPGFDTFYILLVFPFPSSRRPGKKKDTNRINPHFVAFIFVPMPDSNGKKKSSHLQKASSKIRTQTAASHPVPGAVYVSVK